MAFSIMSPHWYPMEPYFEEIKKLMPDLPICIGGYQAMLSQEQTIANPNVDYICVGDGEYAIGNIVQHLRGLKDGPADGMWEKLLDGEVYQTEAHQIGDLKGAAFSDYDVFSKEDGFRDVILPFLVPRGSWCCRL